MATTLREKATRADLLLRDTVLLEAWAMVEKEAWNDIKSSSESEMDKREAAYYRVKAIEAVRDKLQSFVTDLKMQT